MHARSSPAQVRAPLAWTLGLLLSDSVGIFCSQKCTVRLILDSRLRVDALRWSNHSVLTPCLGGRDAYSRGIVLAPLLDGVWIISVRQHDVVWLGSCRLRGFLALVAAAAARRALAGSRRGLQKKRRTWGFRGIGAPTEKRGVSM